MPGPGGVYDQDEYLMTAMEQAAGIDALFDSDGQSIMGNQGRLELHTQLGLEVEAIINAINEREQVEANGKS